MHYEILCINVFSLSNIKCKIFYKYILQQMKFTSLRVFPSLGLNILQMHLQGRGNSAVKMFLPPFWKRLYSKSKELNPYYCIKSSIARY